MKKAASFILNAYRRYMAAKANSKAYRTVRYLVVSGAVAYLMPPSNERLQLTRLRRYLVVVESKVDADRSQVKRRVRWQLVEGSTIQASQNRIVKTRPRNLDASNFG